MKKDVLTILSIICIIIAMILCFLKDFDRATYSLVLAMFFWILRREAERG